MEASIIKSLSYLLAALVMTGVLMWGLKHVSRELSKEDPETKRTVMAEALSEKDDSESKTSFSRVSGALGAVGIAAAFVGMGYWALHGLFFEGANELSKFSSLSSYFYAGSALFAPYAFNRLSGVFK